MSYIPSKVIHETQYNRVWFCATSNELTFETWQPDPAGRGYWIESPTVKLIDIMHALREIKIPTIRFASAYTVVSSPAFEQQVLDAG